jgi:hypothetical protein
LFTPHYHPSQSQIFQNQLFIGIVLLQEMTTMSNLLASAAVPAFKCPKGTKMHILDLGMLEADESWLAKIEDGSL